ncbi:MAG: hypothetical protein LUO93_04800 [Methanomicrobiales archaeon]|nr:hypothetical protein [Methanomicrobiales archaeon]
MQQISASRKKPTGIDVFWQEGGMKRRDFFSFSELIELRINVADLLDNPSLYLIDGENHRVVATD